MQGHNSFSKYTDFFFTLIFFKIMSVIIINYRVLDRVLSDALNTYSPWKVYNLWKHASPTLATCVLQSLPLDPHSWTSAPLSVSPFIKQPLAASYTGSTSVSVLHLLKQPGLFPFSQHFLSFSSLFLLHPLLPFSSCLPFSSAAKLPTFQLYLCFMI